MMRGASAFAWLWPQCENNVMRKSFLTSLAVLAFSNIFPGLTIAQQTPAPTPTTQSTTPKTTHRASTAAKPLPLILKTPKDKTSYAIGLNIGKNMQRDSVDVDPKILARGLQDALTGAKPLLSEDEIKATMTALQTDVRKRQMEKMQAAADANKKQGDDFLAANKAKPGVITLPSGLQYKILQQGNGPKPTATDSVVVNYRGTLLNDTEFDSSYKRGQPATLSLGGVIKGWTEALQLMPVGSKWQLFIPADLAYGSRGQGPVIGPNATLIFEIELLSIQDKSKPDDKPKQ
jgi:FKBP-type peptidyl-prolyl cis-trans isomerase